MRAGFAAVTEDEGVVATAADVNGFALMELRFPPGYVQAEMEPERPYLAVVLDGAMEKTFRGRVLCVEQAEALTMPVGATHAARFGSRGARVLVVKLKDASSPLAGTLGRLADFRAPGSTWLAWRLVAELRRSDAAAPLAAEGLALELLAAASRETDAAWRGGRSPAWLRSAEELLRSRIGDYVGLSEVAEEVGVHPAHLARAFRAWHGVSVGEYGRRVRLEWAARELVCGELPLAVVAAQAGFADQSHFTRCFKRWVGTTPARYRDEAHAVRRRAP
jgi:AraC family transcriptional regulator